MIRLINIENIDGDLERLITAVFVNVSIRIVGYGLSNDWIVLGNTHKAFKNIEDRMAPNCIDLFHLASRITKGYNSVLFELPFAKEDQHGLNGLTQATFGKRLNKTYQQSDWSKRPLLEEQITYAATDALICVKIFKELESMANKANQLSKFQEWCDILVKHRNKLPRDFGHQKKQPTTPELKLFSDGKKSQKKECHSMKPEKPLNDEPIEPPDLKVVCENMLQGLCKKLRLQGVDAVALEAYEHYEVAKELAEKEDRMILTKSLSHATALRKIVKKDHVLYITEEKIEDQIKEVFWYFNVQPDEKYIFSRCPKCNNRTYITIKGSTMLQLHEVLNSLDDSQTTMDKKTIFLPHGKKPSEVSSDYEEARHYVKCTGGEVNMKNGKIRNGGAQLKIKDVHKNVIKAHDEFFGCIKCGKIFWEGSHWDRYLGKKYDKCEPR